MSDKDGDQDCLPERLYENAFVLFMQGLNTLKQDAKIQCEEMEYCNVAWFIKDDFLRWTNELMVSLENELSVDQVRDICRLATLVGSVPCKVTEAPNNKAEQEISMNHPCWEAIRLRAKALIISLGNESQRIDEVLWGE